MDQIVTFRYANCLGLCSMGVPLNWVPWEELSYCYEHGLWLMASQRALLSVSGGMILHSCIAQVDFKSGCDLVLLCYEDCVNQCYWYSVWYMVILLYLLIYVSLVR